MTTDTAAVTVREERLASVDDDGYVRLADGGAARVLLPLTRDQLRAALRDRLPVLVTGEPPIVLGIVAGAAAVPEPRLVLEAARQLVLRCGAAAIRIDADGQVSVVGSEIRSHARRLQRLTGARVRIN